MQTITGLFNTHSEAMTAVTALRENGIAEADISVVANNGDDAYTTNRKLRRRQLMTLAKALVLVLLSEAQAVF